MLLFIIATLPSAEETGEKIPPQGVIYLNKL
jgi:hypothetical protein